MIVVDTNVIAYLWIPGTHTRLAERALEKDPAWCAPLLWRSEFRNVLAGYLRRGFLGLPVALQIAAEAESQMGGHEYSVPSAEVLRRAAGASCSAYDCEFVVLAEELSVPLVTTDRQLLHAFPASAVSLAKYVA
ncbi:MAG: type II toxin-antitoxin system VapC family toxin [Deltaproteobacteria bacterium]|nr:type II toxin-antitoxin system VapC family toxin [Deltaproteobacteria bacterium]